MKHTWIEINSRYPGEAARICNKCEVRQYRSLDAEGRGWYFDETTADFTETLASIIDDCDLMLTYRVLSE